MLPHHPRCRLLATLAIGALTACGSPRLAARPAAPIFQFHTDELWLNLHHFLYVLGRAENGAGDSRREAVSNAPADAERGLTTLSSADQATWRAAVSFYAHGMSQKDLVFDDPLPALTSALTEAGDRASLTGVRIDSALAATLERAAPVYKRLWWPAHRRANIEWRDSTQRMIDQYGSAVLAYITRAYGMSWPANGYPVHLSGYSNWAGAYSTSGNLIVVSSLDHTTLGSLGLESVFHEAMHQWDDSMFVLIREPVRRLGKLVPRDLTHAMIFYTAGEAVRHVIPSHVPYAEVAGVWNRGLAPFREALRRTWQPWLDGQGTRAEALANLAAATAVERRP